MVLYERIIKKFTLAANFFMFESSFHTLFNK